MPLLQAATPDDGEARALDIPQQLDHHWLVTDPAPERHLFRPGTRELYTLPATFHDEDGPWGAGFYSAHDLRLAGAARAYVEGLLPLQQAWAVALAEETARRAPTRTWQQEVYNDLRGVRHRTVTGPESGSAESLLDAMGEGDVTGTIDRYLGPFKHRYPGLQLREWAAGEGAVGQWARAQSDKADPNRSSTRHRAAGRQAAQLKPAATAAWDQFRAELDAWSDEAAAWIRQTTTRPRRRLRAVALK